MRISSSVLESIGNTPLLKLSNVTKGLGLKTNVLAKCEYMNPSGSVKDRMALSMIEQAEKKGQLLPGGMIIDVTSGNTGPALTLVGRAKGYKVRMYIPSKWGAGTYGVSDRIKIMQVLGAEIVEVPRATDVLLELGKLLGESGLGSVTELSGRKLCYDLEKSNPGMIWWARQNTNPDNTLGHRVTGKEILEQTDGRVDAFVTSIGSGGTLLGIGSVLREANSGTKIIGVQPDDQPVMDWIKGNKQDPICDKLGLPRQIGMKHTILQTKFLDDLMNVGTVVSRDMTNRLASDEGLFCGMSSGANVYSAIEVAKKMPAGSNVVTVIVDRRERYWGEWGQERYVV